MDVLLWVLFGVLPAVAAVLVGVGVGGPRWLAPALAVAICVPFGMSDGWPPWPWHLDLMRGPPRPALWWIVLFGGLLGAAYDLRALPRAVAFGGEVLLVLMLPWIVSAPLRAGWSFEGCLAYLGAGWVVMAALWWSLRKAAKAQPGLSIPLAMTVVLGVDAWLLKGQAGAPDWQLAGVAATALGFAVVTTIWCRPFVCGSGAALCMTLFHTGFLLCGRTERELVQLPIVLAWLAPLPVAVARARWFRARPRTAAALGTTLVIAMSALAVWSDVRSG